VTSVRSGFSSLFASPFQKGAVLTMNGIGEYPSRSACGNGLEMHITSKISLFGRLRARTK
jgi:hypothetical protein